VNIGINFEYVRHADKSFEYAVTKAAEMGYAYVEPCLIQGHCTLSEAGYCHWSSMDSRDAATMKKSLDEYGLKTSAVSAHCQIMQGWSVDHLTRAIRYAADLGAPIVNTAEGKRPSWMNETDAMKVIEIHFRAVLQVAEAEGILIGFEPHGEFSTHPDKVVELINRVNSPNLKVNFDPGNTYISGQDPVAYVEALAPYVRHVHAKDISLEQSEQRGKVTGTPVGVAVGKGEIDFVQITKILKKHGFNGVYSVECGTEEQAGESLQYLNKIFADLGVDKDSSTGDLKEVHRP
jgi:sugar phosphate isomerase/epimerase